MLIKLRNICKISFIYINYLIIMGNHSCVFCRIKETDLNRVLYEDEQIIIFKDRSPVADIHLQCIPKRHIKNKNYLTKNELDLLNHMYITTRGFIELNYKEYLINNSAIFGFHKPPFYTITHLHMHCIIPPYTNYIMKTLNYCILKDFNDVLKEIQEKE